MTLALHVKLTVSPFESDYRNLDAYAMEIVNSQYEANQFEILVDGRLVRHEIDTDELSYYIYNDNFIVSTMVMIDEEISDVDGFVSGMQIQDFMINSHMENKMFDVKVLDVNVEYCEMECV